MPTVVETAGFTPLVNGKGLAGWEGDMRLWSVKDGVLVGRSPGLDHNEFLSTTGSYGDYNLSLYFRMIDGKGNSGVQFRSVRIPHHEMSGYQADIGEGYWGSLYDESRRNKVLVAASNEALAALNKTDWNHYVDSCGRRQDRAVHQRQEVGRLPRAGRGGRAVGTAGGADPRGRADGGPVQGRDDSAAADPDRRQLDSAGLSTCGR